MRIRAEDTDESSLSWSLALRDVESDQDRLLASGTDPVRNGNVIALAADALVSEHAYALVLTVVGARATATAEARLHRDDALFTLIPLYPRARDDLYAIHSVDASGMLLVYSGKVAHPAELILHDRRTGQRESVFIPLSHSEGVKLSADGSRVLAEAFFPTDGLGYIDLLTKTPVLMAAAGTHYYSADSAGVRVVYQGLASNRTVQFFMYDENTRERRQLTDDPKAILRSGVICPKPSGATPLINLDGTTVVLITSATLALVPEDPAAGCRVFGYDVATRALRHVVSLPRTLSFGLASVSPDGRSLCFAAVQQLPDDTARLYPALLDLETGALRDAVPDRGDFTRLYSTFDSLLTGDGRGVVFSTQADLDPRAGNGDHNMELFHYEFATETFTQITQTTGGIKRTSGGCEPLRPAISHDAGVVTFFFKLISIDPCRLDGPMRHQRDGFVFNGVRAVRKRSGNAGPLFTPPPNQRLVAGDTLTLDFAASDSDGDPLSFFAQVKDGDDIPPGSEITDHHDGTATFHWPTRPEHVGDYRLRVAAFDEGGGEVFHDLTISVVPRGGAATTTTPSPSPISTPSAGVCVGDCDGDGAVAVGELVTGVNIALDTVPLASCPAFACDGGQQLGINCITRGVRAALDGCPE